MRLRKQTILWILLVCVVVAVLIFLPEFAVKPLPLGMGI